MENQPGGENRLTFVRVCANASEWRRDKVRLTLCNAPETSAGTDLHRTDVLVPLSMQLESINILLACVLVVLWHMPGVCSVGDSCS